MPKRSTPRQGSLQFYPRVRAKQILNSVSWKALESEKIGLLGFIGYKVGMKSAYIRDNTPNSHTKGQRITIPVTLIECPPMKVFSVRFYKDNRVIGEVMGKNLDSELKRKLKLGKKEGKKIEDFSDFDDVRLLVYSQVKKTGIKKKPDMVEIGLNGNKEEKIDFVKKNLDKEILISEIFDKGLVDIRGVTKGKGNQGPTKRFGLRLGSHKKEKGVRGPGSGGPWHPARVEFTQPMAGQMGYHSRIDYNKNILEIGDIKNSDINSNEGFRGFGKIKSNYMIVNGSVLGVKKRAVLVSSPLRPSKEQLKKKYEFIELR